ncbi:MAG: complex I NDUFA9 subunit family protein [Anaerolineales bacterium]|nr:complex I NDUFA9 subunit family protein [Anaerolineales bacterium]
MIYITGGSGFLGSHIVEHLTSKGSEVRVLVRDRERALQEGRLAGLEIDWVDGDVTRPESLAAGLEGVDQIIHTAAIAIEKGQATYEEVNFQGTVNLVDAAKEAGIKRFINISQLGASPELPYRFLASKGRAQAYVARSGLDWTAFRPSVIWGPEDEFANTFARLVPITPIIFPVIGGEEARFQPVWVEDVASAAIGALDDPGTWQKEFELGGPEVLTLEQIERRVMQAIDAKRLMVRFPMPLLRFAVKMMELALPNPPVTSSLLELLQVENVTSDNALNRFVESPRAFDPEYLAAYMKDFTVRDTLRSFMGRV